MTRPVPEDEHARGAVGDHDCGDGKLIPAGGGAGGRDDGDTLAGKSDEGSSRVRTTSAASNGRKAIAST